MARLRFTKMHGIGNDYVYVDCFSQTVSDPPALAERVAPRRTAIGSDGLILICPSEQADCRMEMYNADGSRGRMCGNGIRCVAKYVYDHNIARRESLRIETDAGIKDVRIHTANGRAHIKTGTLDGVRAFAGYVLDHDGRRHAVVMMVNHPEAAASQAAQDALIEWVWAGAPG